MAFATIDNKKRTALNRPLLLFLVASREIFQIDTNLSNLICLIWTNLYKFCPLGHSYSFTNLRWLSVAEAVRMRTI